MSAQDDDKDEADKDKGDTNERIRYSYSIVVESDIDDEAKKKEMVEICQIACEKHVAAEKLPMERNNQAAALHIKEALDKKMNGPFNVIVGESFSMEIVHVQKTLLYMFYGGYVAVLVYKCV